MIRSGVFQWSYTRNCWTERIDLPSGQVLKWEAVAESDVPEDQRKQRKPVNRGLALAMLAGFIGATVTPPQHTTPEANDD